MVIVIRTDASNEIGSGHVMRSLTLAKQLKRQGMKVIFICRELDGNCIDLINNQGFSVISLPYKKDYNDVDSIKANWKSDAQETIESIRKLSFFIDLLIVDHYDLGRSWELKLRPYTKKIMVVDDLANRTHDCDILLDGGFLATEKSYVDLVPIPTNLLIGAKYTILREQFKINKKERFNDERSYLIVHIFFGGKDVKNLTTHYSKLLLKNIKNIKIIAVVSGGYTDKKGLEQIEKRFKGRFNWYQNITDMASLMKECDIAFGAPGITTWERMCVGLPSAYIATHFNQVSILKKLKHYNLCEYLGEYPLINDEHLLISFRTFIKDKANLKTIFEKSIKAIDGDGVTRILRTIRRTLK